VAQVDRDLLPREADAGGLSGFTAFLDQGGQRSAVVSTILASSEYHTLLVRAAFETYLHRDPDPIGLNAFVSFLNSGGTVEQMQSLIISSAEYLQVRGGGTNLGFIETVFLGALHRHSESFGRANNDLLFAEG